ncbi:MAG TPA: LysM peptidoglycan-binding domain-containing protein [Oligoflexus sp.]|uniref:LysM peptidoglycan-binding domain-containing protein n=1 Tax=Oligoflexus sp. TaxID=1971216 RepID=UPI002D809E69|nr:LysM peptidoglycan-binding domain-containing protein [Oligoflexus sp.]HET9238838.1 LysM peptidoglycan-binding domain-containing protein [Oligoflexus sp.]
MRTLRRFYTGLALSALILSSNCTTSDSGDVEDSFEAADAGNQVVEVQKDEINDSEIPDPEQVAADAQRAAESAGESIDGNSSGTIQDLTAEQQAEQKSPDLPEDHPADASNYQMAEQNKTAQPVSDVEPAAQTDSLPSLSQVVAESDTPADTASPMQNSMVSASDAGMDSTGTMDSEKPAKARKNKVRKTRSPRGTEHLSGNFYIVQPGDTLGQISTIIFGTSRRWQDLATANSLDANTPIFPGDVLRYPADSASASFESAYKNLPRSKVVVQKGDTLELIAERQLGNKAFWKLVWRWNEAIIAEPNRIFEGQSLDYIAAEELTALLSDRKGLKSAH